MRLTNYHVITYYNVLVASFLETSLQYIHVYAHTYTLINYALTKYALRKILNTKVQVAVQSLAGPRRLLLNPCLFALTEYTPQKRKELMLCVEMRLGVTQM